jgi:hypothetical protein
MMACREARTDKMDKIRVTKLVEFSSSGRLFTLGIGLKITYVSSANI